MKSKEKKNEKKKFNSQLQKKVIIERRSHDCLFRDGPVEREREGVGFWFARVKYICQLYKVPPNLVRRKFFTLAFI